MVSIKSVPQPPGCPTPANPSRKANTRVPGTPSAQDSSQVNQDQAAEVARSGTLASHAAPARVDPHDLMDAIGSAVMVTDLDGLVVGWNTAAESLYGWTAREVVGRPISQTALATLDQCTLDMVLATLRGGLAWSATVQVRRRDGSTVVALVTQHGMHQNGCLTAVVVSTVPLGSGLHALLARSTDAALVLGVDSVVTYANPAAQQLFGWEDKRLVGSSAIPLFHPEDRAPLSMYLTRVVEQPGAHPPLEIRVRRTGSWTWAEVAVSNLLDDALVRGVVCHLRLARRRIAQEEAEIRAAQLQTALDTRVIIEQAKGFLSGRAGVPPEHAFTRIRKHARCNQLSIREASRRVLSGEVDLSH